ncbi:MAG: short-chain dehydrogenase [Planctomycetes bacterium]|nr:short-chain dehydrogenase [Planctomycetota bacterium]
MQCKAHSIFQCHEKIEPDRDLPPSLYHNYIFTLLLTCSRKKDHEILFLFFANDGKLQKIGQYPSLADLATPDIYKYRNILGDERYKEFTRGVGLASHGVGIGAFVYFRRIFEFLIEKAHLVAKSIINWDEDKYIKSRMDEKITLLQAHLPEVLVKTKSLYGILSKGIHSLTEDECLDSFKVVKLGIELILDEELARKTREDKIRVASKDIGTLGNLLKRDEK